MKFLKVTLVAACFLFCTNPAYADDDVRVVYEKPKNSIESAVKLRLEKSGVIEAVTTFINDSYHLPKRLVFSFGAEYGPLYDSEINQISVPYSFIEEIENRFIAAKYEESGVSVQEATDDALMHTLFHEFAHAAIYMYELPVLGKEEDAADGLSTVLLTEFFDDGQEIAISAADLFNLESSDVETLEKEDFWDEHSLDIQRYYSTLCYVYGSDPEKYATYIDEHLSEERAELCVEEYEMISQSWLVLLRPHMKHAM